MPTSLTPAVLDHWTAGAAATTEAEKAIAHYMGGGGLGRGLTGQAGTRHRACEAGAPWGSRFSFWYLVALTVFLSFLLACPARPAGARHGGGVILDT
ncbi:hypothetical protein, partial [Halomonas sp. ND22Bw]|uniref:hypothetical protein n=1 Tax=Halomonas sp. ND22Bw TaxID=2054178 RepID=UPI001C62579A